MAPDEVSEDRLREALLARCRAEHIEPPGRTERIIAAARSAASDGFCATTVSRLGAEAADRLELLAADDGEDGQGRGVLPQAEGRSRTDKPGQLARRGGQAGSRPLPLAFPPAFSPAPPGPVVDAWRARAAMEYPSDLRERPRPVRLTLLAALCWARTGEITDGLVELLIGVVHKLGTRAEDRVEGALLADLRRVRGKEAILFRLAAAALEHPDETVRSALYPVVSEATLRDLVKEANANEVLFRARVRKALRSSYSSYYRRMLPGLLGALEFRSNNSAHRPVIEALELLGRYAHRPGTVRYYAAGEPVPLVGVVPAESKTLWSTSGTGSSASPMSCACSARSRRAAPTRGMGGGGQPLAGPRGRPAGRFRGQPRGPLQRPAPTTRPHCVHRRLRRQMRTALASLDEAVRRTTQVGSVSPPARVSPGQPSQSPASYPSRPTGPVEGPSSKAVGHHRPA